MSDYDHVEVNMLPGTMNHKSKETVGSTALTALQQLHCDLVLLGISSIDPEHGITTPYLESAETTRNHQGGHQGHEPHHTREIRTHLHLQNR